MWVPQSPTLHMMSCTDHAFLWCPSCFSPSAHTEPHSTNCPVSTTCTTQSSLKSSLFKCGLFGNFGTLPFGCIVFHTVVHCSLHFDQVPRKCVLDTVRAHCQSTLEHSVLPACSLSRLILQKLPGPAPVPKPTCGQYIATQGCSVQCSSSEIKCSSGQ